MTRTTEAFAIKIGDQIRDDRWNWVTVTERESFKRGTRIWICLEDGTERTFCAATTIVLNRPEPVVSGTFDAHDLV